MERWSRRRRNNKIREGEMKEKVNMRMRERIT